MKQDLVKLISAIPTIETHFRKFEPGEGLCALPEEYIYDDPKFIEWQEAVKFELQEIFDRTNDTYIWNIIPRCSPKVVPHRGHQQGHSF